MLSASDNAEFIRSCEACPIWLRDALASDAALTAEKLAEVLAQHAVKPMRAKTDESAKAESDSPVGTEAVVPPPAPVALGEGAAALTLDGTPEPKASESTPAMASPATASDGSGSTTCSSDGAGDADTSRQEDAAAGDAAAVPMDSAA